MKETGSMIKQMALESIYTLMGLATRELGEMICSMVKEKRLGQMVQFMKVNIKWGRNTDMEFITGMMVLGMRVNG